MPQFTAPQHEAAIDIPNTLSVRIVTAGRLIALVGVILPLLLIGGLKFTQIEIDALKPFISGTPWLAWMYPVFGEAGASYLLGVIEIATALLLIASLWSARAGIVGGSLAALTFFITTSLLLSLPVWETALGGFPALNTMGSFLIKDVALFGISLMILGESLAASKQSVQPARG